MQQSPAQLEATSSVGVHAPAIKVLAHRGKCFDMLLRHETECAKEVTFNQGRIPSGFSADLMKRIADGRNIILAGYHVIRHERNAKGSDGIGPRDLSQRDIHRLAKQLGRRIEQGEYQRSPIRRVLINQGTKPRTISVACVIDRIVDRATYQIVSPIIERLCPQAYCRRGQGVPKTLTAIRSSLERDGSNGNLIRQDISKAFDHVQWDRMQAQLLSIGLQTEIINLLAAITRLESTAQPAEKNQRGIVQGASCSPMLLNLLVQRTIIRAIFRDCAWIGYYLDDVIALPLPGDDPQKLATKLSKQLTSNALPPKYSIEDSILKQGRSYRLLGYDIRVRKDEGKHILSILPKEVGRKLEQQLTEASFNPDAQRGINELITSDLKGTRHTDLATDATLMQRRIRKIRKICRKLGYPEIANSLDHQHVPSNTHAPPASDSGVSMDQIISELTAWRFAPSQPLSLDSTINLTPVVHNGKPNPTRVYIAGHVGNSSDPGICGFAIWPPRDHGPTGKLLEIHNADLEVLQLCAIVGGLNEIPDRGRVLLLVPNKHIFEVITLHLGYCESYQMRIRTPRGLKRLRNSVLWQLVSEKLRRLHVVVKLIDHHRKDCYALDQLKLKITNSVKERQARLQREALESIMNGRHTFQTSIPQDAPFQRFNRANFVSHLTSPG